MRPLSILARLAAPIGRLTLVLLALVASAHAQDASDWRAYPAYNEVRALASSDDALWAGTPGGIFSYVPATGEITRYTAIDGLRGGDLQTVAFDRVRNVLWAGYADGAIDRLDVATGTITNVLDVTRAVQYTPRGIRRIRVVGDSLYLATDFGVVVYDAVAGRVRNTYARLGTVPAGTPVNDVIVTPLPDGTPGVWVATPAGIVRAPRDAALQSPTAWTVEPEFPFPSFSLGVAAGQVYVGGGPAGARDLYRQELGGAWTRVLFTDIVIAELTTVGDAVLALDRSGLSRVRPGQPRTYFQNADAVTLTSTAVGPGGTLWVSDAGYGLLPLPESQETGTVSYDLAPVVPTGPFTNLVADVDVASDGTVWVATRQLDPVRASAVSRFDGTTWTNYLTTDPSLDIGSTTFRSGIVGPDDRFYAGGDGSLASDRDGLTVFTDGVPMLYGEANSSLQGAAGERNMPTPYIVTIGIAFEGDLRWVLNSDATNQLHLFDGSDQWTALPTPAGIASTSTMVRLVVDGFGYKWITLPNVGVAIWDTGADPANPADDRGRSFTTEGGGGQGLPNINVRALAVDGRGRVWIGTARGIAYVFSPGSAFSNDPSLATPQWPIVIGADDGSTDDANYLLRDVSVNDLAVDPAGRVWVATTSGAYLLNAEGNDLDRQIDARNSPLPTDDIQRVAVDPSSGRVYFSTTFGLYSVDGDATRATPNSEGLTVAPNPFRPADAFSGVLISGLNAATTSVRILTVAGEVIHARDAAGGSFRWDGRDDRTGQLAVSGVYIVAAASETGATIYGKVAVIR